MGMCGRALYALGGYGVELWRDASAFSKKETPAGTFISLGILSVLLEVKKAQQDSV